MPDRVDESEKIEKILSKVFDTLWSRIKIDKNYPDNPIQLKTDYNSVVYTAIRKAVERVYREGMDYVTEVTNVDTYFTETDLAEIKKLTDAGVTKFWTQIEAQSDRETGNESLNFIGAEANPLFNIQYFLHSVATWITVSGLSISTSKKAEQILIPTSTPEGIRGDSQDIPYVMKWITQRDERVCPICRSLNGKIFRPDKTNAYSIPLPPDSSHPRCRCYLELILSKTNKLALIPNRFKISKRVRMSEI